MRIILSKFINLHWKFTNGHEWSRLFADEDDAMLAVYNFGLFTHPFIDSVRIDHTDESGNLLDRKVLL